MRFRLLQARTSADPVRDEEPVQFAARMGVSPEQVLQYDLLAGQSSFEAVTDGVDGVLVGGSGAYSVLDDEAWLAPFFETMGALADRGFPTFASCFGFQAVVVALGGEVVHDPDNAEVGTYEMSRTTAGDACAVFSQLPDRFWAQLGHKDRAARLPADAINLVESERCPFQAIRLSDKPFWATQFHPELTKDDNVGRLMRYWDEYVHAFGEDEAQRLVDNHRPSPHDNDLLRHFVDHLRNRITP